MLKIADYSLRVYLQVEDQEIPQPTLDKLLAGYDKLDLCFNLESYAKHLVDALDPRHNLEVRVSRD